MNDFVFQHDGILVTVDDRERSGDDAGGMLSQEFVLCRILKQQTQDEAQATQGRDMQFGLLKLGK